MTSLYHSRRIVPMEWHGRIVEVVEGLWARRRLPLDGFLATASPSVATPLSLGIEIVEKPSGPALAGGVTMASPGTSVLWEEPLFVHRGSAPPNDPRLAEQWGLRAIAAEAAFVSGGDPGSVWVAVLDSGLPLNTQGQLSHPDLRAGGRIRPGQNHVNATLPPRDDHGHGSHILGILGAETNNGQGIAGLWSRGTILVSKVLDHEKKGTANNFHQGVLEALRAAEQEGVNLVVNYSAGGDHPVSETIRTALQFAQARGALIVAAAGNRGIGSGRIEFPAAHSLDFPNVIAVGAINQNVERLFIASSGPALTLAAPGEDILSTLPDYPVTSTLGGGLSRNYDVLSGTSQATAFVSALAALVWSRDPQMTAEEVRQKLIDTADRLPGGATFSNDFGFGLINVNRALA